MAFANEVLYGLIALGVLIFLYYLGKYVSFCNLCSKERFECNYKYCDARLHQYKYCDEHYKIRNQFVEKYHILDKNYNISESVVCTVELEMRLKYVDLFGIKSDEKHKLRNGHLFKRINKKCDLYKKTTYIKKNARELNQYVQKINNRQAEQQNEQLQEIVIHSTSNTRNFNSRKQFGPRNVRVM